MITNLLKAIPYVKQLQEHHQKLQQENSELQQQLAAFHKACAFGPGHFYSVLVSVNELATRADDIWSTKPQETIPGIDLKPQEQLNLVEQFGTYYKDLPFGDEKKEGTRYYFVNDYYCHTDGIMLYSMMRHYQPKKIIEIGSGFSSALMLDTNETFFNNSMQLTFIEPYPDRLHSLLKEPDKGNTTIIEKGVQSIALATFEALEAGDILFVDSTHVVKTGSDVNYILFDILPALKPGVLIHFHDIYYPFEYPKNWVMEGRNWNEDYFLRAFLQYNNRFEIKLFATYLHQFHSEVFAQLPLCYYNTGSSLWLQKM